MPACWTRNTAFKGHPLIFAVMVASYQSWPLPCEFAQLFRPLKAAVPPRMDQICQIGLIYIQLSDGVTVFLWKSTVARGMAKKELREYLKILFPYIWSGQFCWLIAPVTVIFLEYSLETVTGKRYWNQYVVNQAKSEFLVQTALIPRDICIQSGNKRNSVQLIRLINWISMSYLHNQLSILMSCSRFSKMGNFSKNIPICHP